MFVIGVDSGQTAQMCRLSRIYTVCICHKLVESTVYKRVTVYIHQKFLTHKAPSKICSRRHSKFFFYFLEKTSLAISCESSAKQTIHMKCQDLFSLKNKKKIKNKKLSSAAVVIGALRVKVVVHVIINDL